MNSFNVAYFKMHYLLKKHAKCEKSDTLRNLGIIPFIFETRTFFYTKLFIYLCSIQNCNVLKILHNQFCIVFVVANTISLPLSEQEQKIIKVLLDGGVV